MTTEYISFSATISVSLSYQAERCNFPCALVAPRSELRELYTDEDACFSIIQPDVGNLCVAYERFVELEMKGDDLMWEQIADRCVKVPTQSHVAERRLEILMQLMNKKVTLVTCTDAEHLEEIKSTKFLAVKKKPAEFPLPWCCDGCDYTSCKGS
jgi:hypothetical protein